MISDAAAAHIAAAYGLGEGARLDGLAARGEQGQVWRLSTDRGSYAVKESFAEQDPEEARRHAAFQRLGLDAGVPAPEVLEAATGPLSVVDGVPVRVYTWVDLCDRDPLLDPQAVGRLAATLHRVHVPAAGAAHWWYTEPVGREEWQGLVAASREAGAPYAERLADRVGDLVAAEATTGTLDPVQTCHLDLWAENLRATPGGGLCLIDWENSGPGDPAGELALLLFEFARTDPARAAVLHAAYADAGGPARLRGRRDFGMVVAQLGHILRMHLRAYLDPAAGAAARAHALRGIEEGLDEPLTLAVVDGLLDAVQGTGSP